MHLFLGALHIRHLHSLYANNGAQLEMKLNLNRTATTPMTTEGSEVNQTHVSLAQRIEHAYAAGVVDGEGCIYYSKTTMRGRRNPTYRLGLSIGQNHHGLLVRVARALDVPPRIYPVKRTLGMNRDAEVLQIGDQHALKALQTILPYLTRKKPEAAVAIAGYELGQLRVHPGPQGHAPEIWAIRERCYKKLQKMK